jgi:hypothetical protein
MGSRAVATVSLFVPAGTVLVSWLAWRDELPDVIASHWSDLGTPDGTAPATAMLALGGGTALLAAVAGTVFGRARRRLFWSGSLAGLTAGVWLVPAWLTLRAGEAQAAVLGGWILAVVACACYGVVPFLLAGRRELG